MSRNEPLPVAIVLGALPDINFVSAANLPYGVDELSVAGGIRERPVDVVPCKAIDLEVPAEAEIVIEGRARVSRGDRRQSDHHAAQRHFYRHSSWPAAERIQRDLAHVPRDDALQPSPLWLRHAGSVGGFLPGNGRRLELVGN